MRVVLHLRRPFPSWGPAMQTPAKPNRQRISYSLRTMTQYGGPYCKQIVKQCTQSSTWIQHHMIHAESTPRQ